MPYDLLIKGGHVFDPGQRLDGQMDIAINAGQIAPEWGRMPGAGCLSKPKQQF